MSTPYIIELSRKNADYVNNEQNNFENAEWKNTIKTAVTINDGDQISIRNVFINTGDDIVIDNDLTVTLEFGFYDVNTTLTGKETQGIPTPPTPTPTPIEIDNDYYIAYEVGTAIGTLESWKVYSPGDFACDAVFKFQYTDTAGNIQVFFTKRWYSSPGDDPEVTLTWAKYGDSSVAPQMVMNSFKLLSMNGHDLYETGYVPGSAQFLNPSILGNAPLLKTVQVVIPQGIYTKNGFATTLSDLMQSAQKNYGTTFLTSGSNFLMRTDDPQFDSTSGGKDLYFAKCGARPQVNTQVYQYKSGGSLTSYWMGASEVDIIWDADTSQFAWQYFHTPYADAGDQGVAVIKDGSKFTTVTEQCGIYFTSLEPVTLWQDIMGFNLSSLLCVNDLNVDDPSLACVSKDQLIAKTTHGFFSLASLLLQYNRAVPNATINLGTNLTSMLKANNIYSNAGSGGFFLVEINFTGKKFYFYGDKVNGGISAIVSNYSLQDNYVTGYSDSSINYIHQGASFNLNSFSVRILDANTKQPIKTLGENSFIFVQVDKNVTGQIQQLQKPKPHK